MKYLFLYPLYIFICFTSCKEARFQNKNQTPIKKASDTLQFNGVSLYTIDASIYHEMDTTWDFPDGKPAYIEAFDGGAFVDSFGSPIHNRYESYELSTQQIKMLKQYYITQLRDNLRGACSPMYRDVLIFFDVHGKVTGQAQICFGCYTIATYPSAKFQFNSERTLDYAAFKTFINIIRQH